MPGKPTAQVKAVKKKGNEKEPKDAPEHKVPQQKEKTVAKVKKAAKKEAKDLNKEVKDSFSPSKATFSYYNLDHLGVPRVAWPDACRPNCGKHGYTKICEANGAEIQLHQETFAFEGNAKHQFQWAFVERFTSIFVATAPCDLGKKTSFSRPQFKVSTMR